jgi:hypothetical protein
VTGTVLSVDPQAKSVTIKADGGMSQTFLLSDPIWMRSAGKDISISELKVGDRVRIEPTPGAGSDAPTRTASRLEVLGTGSAAESPTMNTGTQPGTPSPQRTVSTERPVLGEPADAGEDQIAMPSGAGSTTGRPVSTDRPVLGQKPDTSTTGSPTPTTSTTTGTTLSPTPPTPPSTGSSTYVSPTPTPPPSTGSSSYGSSATTTSPSPSTTPSTSTTGTRYGTPSTASSTSTSAEELPATASPLPFVAVLGLIALAAGFVLRATRKQLS